jgi:hypothetical protein
MFNMGDSFACIISCKRIVLHLCEVVQSWREQQSLKNTDEHAWRGTSFVKTDGTNVQYEMLMSLELLFSRMRRKILGKNQK